MVKLCCICGNDFTEYGNNPDPFPGEMGMCCDDCNNRFVTPVRLLFGRGVTELTAPLGLLQRIAATGAGIVKSQKLARELWEKHQPEKTV